MSTQASFVHFPHPGREHRPESDLMPWNTGPHGRKFMKCEGRYLGGGSELVDGPVVFWGEWEGPSRVLGRWPRDADLPMFLHEPFWEYPAIAGPRQNTDPWVFGDSFRYSNCKQLTDIRSCRPSALQRLAPGSVIVFGSGLGGRFVLDTVIVVEARVGSFVPAAGNSLDQDEAFFHSTLDSLDTYEESVRHASFTLYRGATPDRTVNEMFSFVPCLPLGADVPRFARPVIELPGAINPRSWQAPAGAGKLRPSWEVKSLWESVVQQVIDQGLALAVRLELPGPGPGSIAPTSGPVAVGGGIRETVP